MFNLKRTSFPKIEYSKFAAVAVDVKKFVLVTSRDVNDSIVKLFGTLISFETNE
jgi:hypothetical protein